MNGNTLNRQRNSRLKQSLPSLESIKIEDSSDEDEKTIPNSSKKSIKNIDCQDKCVQTDINLNIFEVFRTKNCFQKLTLTVTKLYDESFGL